jgi:hypothetical protein
MKRFHVPVFLFLVFGLNLLVLGWSTVVADSALPSASATQIPIEYETEFRQSYGFRSDLDYVKAVRAASDSIFLESIGGIILTPSELNEFETRLEVEKDADTLLEFFNNHPYFQDAFGGIYIEHFAGAEDYTKGGKLVLQLVEGHSESQNILSHLPPLQHSDRLVVQWVTFSDSELEAVFNSVPRIVTGSAKLSAIYKDVKRNHIGVVLDLNKTLTRTPSLVQKSLLPQQWHQQLSHPAISVYNGQVHIERTAVQGGTNWSSIKGENDWCTVGFEVKERASGRYAVLTAGHCATERNIKTYQAIYQGKRHIGWMMYYQEGAASPYGVGVDAAFIRTRSGSIAIDNILHLGTSRDIQGETSDYTIGKNRCWSGQKTGGTRCGPITCQNLEFQDGSSGLWNNRVFSIDAAPIPGDSGAPAYEVLAGSGNVSLLVTGIMFARTDTPFAACMNGIDGLGSRWQDISNFYGLTLVTK